MFNEASFLMQTANSFPLLTIEREKEITARYKATQSKADFDLLVNSNLRFVIKVAFEFKKYGMPLVDLIQEGTIGLMRAVNKFDPARNLRLVTYAVWWIRAHINNYLMANWSMVKIGSTQAERQLFFMLSRGKREVEQHLPNGEIASAEEIAEMMRLPLHHVSSMLGRMASRDASMDSPIKDKNNEGEGATFTDHLTDGAPDAETRLDIARETHATYKKIHQGLWRLGRVEADVIRCRYLTEPRLTLAETALRHGFSRERARQLEMRALEKLKKYLRLVGEEEK